MHHLYCISDVQTKVTGFRNTELPPVTQWVLDSTVCCGRICRDWIWKCGLLSHYKEFLNITFQYLWKKYLLYLFLVFCVYSVKNKNKSASNCLLLVILNLSKYSLISLSHFVDSGTMPVRGLVDDDQQLYDGHFHWLLHVLTTSVNTVMFATHVCDSYLIITLTPGQCLWCCHHRQSHYESSPSSFGVCRLNARWPPTLRPSQPTWTVSPPVGCYHPRHHCHLLLWLLSPKADTHFTVLRRVEGWIVLGTAVRMCSPCPGLYITVAVIRGVRTPKHVNWLTQYLTWVITSTMSRCMLKFTANCPSVCIPEKRWNIILTDFLFCDPSACLTPETKL